MLTKHSLTQSRRRKRTENGRWELIDRQWIGRIPVRFRALDSAGPTTEHLIGHLQRSQRSHSAFPTCSHLSHPRIHLSNDYQGVELQLREPENFLSNRILKVTVQISGKFPCKRLEVSNFSLEQYAIPPCKSLRR